MKKLLALTTALLTLMSAAPAYTAAADQGECAYPESFVSRLQFTKLADYALCPQNDERAYADSTVLYVIAPDANGDAQLTRTDCGNQIDDIDYDAEGNLYIGLAGGETIAYPSLAPAEYEFEESDEAVADGYELKLSTGKGYLYAIGEDNMPVTIFEEGASRLKMYDGKAYVMHGGEVYMLDGATPVVQPAEYTDFSATHNIFTGDAAQKLAGDYTVKTVAFSADSIAGGDVYATEIDLSAVGEKFTALGTIKITDVRSALAIAETGNATIIVMKGSDGLNRAYLTLTASLEQTDYSPPSADMEGALAREDTHLYSRPYMCGATQIAEIKAGTKMTVEGKFALSWSDDVFYRVTCEVDGAEVTGYAAAGMLTPYTFSAEKEEGQTTGTGNFEYGDDTLTVVIVLLIVLLVLIAIGYVAFYLTRKDKPRARRKGGDDGLYT